jgi:hypothetical protein
MRLETLANQDNDTDTIGSYYCPDTIVSKRFDEKESIK